MTPKQWERFLLGVTGKVMAKVSAAANGGNRGKSVGVGASGDRTIYADRVAEEVILSGLRALGGVKVLSEEAGFAGDAEGRTLAVVDPLDGSSNFARGIPFYCTSVAIVEGDRIDDVSAAAVRDLVSGDVYSACRGGGARRNGRPIKTSSVSKAASAIAGVDMSSGGERLAEGLAPLLGAVKRQVHFGANALEICYVADGKTDAFVDIRGRIRVTDFAGAYLIAREAGAIVTDAKGDDLRVSFDLRHRFSLVASANARLHREIMGLVMAPAVGV